MSAFDYWTYNARDDPAAVELARSIGLKFHVSRNAPVDSGHPKYPIRRLIITGLDTPRNLRVFFGPRFQMVGRVLRGERISVLLDEVHVYSRRWDHGYPYFAPRPASAAEAKFVPQLREYREYETKGVYDDSDDYTSEDENHPDEGEKFSVTMRMGRMKRRRLGNSILF